MFTNTFRDAAVNASWQLEHSSTEGSVAMKLQWHATVRQHCQPGSRDTEVYANCTTYHTPPFWMHSVSRLPGLVMCAGVNAGT